MNRFFIILCCMLVPFSMHSQTLAFPEAEGFGKYAVGGRGGKIIKVTNLNDSGNGSLREAVEQKGVRTVVFTVSGNIELKSHLRINNDSITIAGQTAPGDGICLKDMPLSINASNVIVRYIRCRLGDKYHEDNDALTGGAYGLHDVIIDHVSASWSIDECLSLYKIRNLTVQWCIVAQSLTNSIHTKGAHGFGGIWGGHNATFHHNLLADNSSRNPRFSSVEGTENVDFRNNVIFNWGFKSSYGGGRHGRINIVGNYYKPGPASLHHRILDVAQDGTGRYYVSGNYMYGDSKVTNYNWSAVGGIEPLNCKVNTPFSYMPIKEQKPQKVYKLVMKYAGCSYHRDKYDRMIVMQMRKNKGICTTNGLIDSQEQVGGWPVLKVKCCPKDSDGDGMPDVWEIKNGLDPFNSLDANIYADNLYTNLENYINSIVVK